MRVGPHLSGPHKRSGPIRSGLTVVCVLCGKDSPRTGRFQTKCSECRKSHIRQKTYILDYAKLWRQTHREIVRAAKNHPCMDCGEVFHHSLMDFDHRSGEVKGFNIAIGMFRFGKEKLLAEIAKCDVVCCLCHRIRTWNRAHPQEHIIRK